MTIQTYEENQRILETLRVNGYIDWEEWNRLNIELKKTYEGEE